jgi:DNA-binding PadR family transcriptional regulator
MLSRARCMGKRKRDVTDISDLEYLTLNALIPKPLYGYAIRKDIEKWTEGQIKPSLATLYDILHRLLKDHLIEEGEDEIIDGRLRRTYQITGLGEQAMAQKRQIAALLARRRAFANES